MSKHYYFAAGPAMLPAQVIEQIQAELPDYQSTGLSVLELNHRSVEFTEILDHAENSLRQLLNLGEQYKILFMQGGATHQFDIVPMNLLPNGSNASYVVTGHWSKKAAEEAVKHGEVKRIDALLDDQQSQRVLPVCEWEVNSDSRYVHIAQNETVGGIELPGNLDLPVPIVSDMTSSIMTQTFDMNRYGLIYAGVQKMLGIAGLCLVIVREDMLQTPMQNVPRLYRYDLAIKERSMANTPPVFAIYVLKLMLEWILDQGGLSTMERLACQRAQLIYDAVDGNDLYQNAVAQDARSRLNVPFRIADKRLEAQFLEEASQSGLGGLQGHRLFGGIRASMYNAMPLQGAKALSDFMWDFAKRKS